MFAIGVTLAVAVITLSLFLKEKRKKWKKVGKVARLFLYPAKSMRGVLVDGLLCTKQGMRSLNHEIYDRSFLLVQPDGNMMTARKEPRMVTISVEPVSGGVTLSAPDTPSITVPFPTDESKGVRCKVWSEESLGVDCGDDVSKWLTSYLKKPYRLLYHSPNISGRHIAGRDARLKPHFLDTGKILYQDVTPATFLSDASVNDLNSRLPEEVTVRRFRPNIFVTGCKPYGEDEWEHIRIGKAEFKYVRDTFRCALTTIDPDTGIVNADDNPLTTLRTYRNIRPIDFAAYGKKSPMGTSHAVLAEGEISVGDDVYACD